MNDLITELNLDLAQALGLPRETARKMTKIELVLEPGCLPVVMATFNVTRSEIADRVKQVVTLRANLLPKLPEKIEEV